MQKQPEKLRPVFNKANHHRTVASAKSKEQFPEVEEARKEEAEGVRDKKHNRR